MKTEIVKFRLPPVEKVRLIRVAGERSATLSSLLRRAAHLVSHGRIDDAALRADMVEIRRVANAITAIAERFKQGDQTAASDAHDAAENLRRVTHIHLTNVS